MTDNAFLECPARMNYGARFLTDYSSAIEKDLYIALLNKKHESHHDYRKFLQSHGKELLDREWASDKAKACWHNQCIFQHPRTAVSPDVLVKEMEDYNKIYYGKRVARKGCSTKDYRLNP
jgi:hypothetical protein